MDDNHARWHSQETCAELHWYWHWATCLHTIDDLHWPRWCCNGPTTTSQTQHTHCHQHAMSILRHVSPYISRGQSNGLWANNAATWFARTSGTTEAGSKHRAADNITRLSRLWPPTVRAMIRCMQTQDCTDWPVRPWWNASKPNVVWNYTCYSTRQLVSTLACGETRTITLAHERPRAVKPCPVRTHAQLVYDTHQKLALDRPSGIRVLAGDMYCFCLRTCCLGEREHMLIERDYRATVCASSAISV